MNRFENLVTLIAQDTPAVSSESGFDLSSIETIIAAALIVAAGLIGLIVGFAIGARYGKMSGELRVLKSIKTSKRSSSSSRSRSSSDSDSNFDL